MPHTAHINENGIQTVGEHCRNTAELSSYFAKDYLAENIGYLQGLLHDMGKLTQRFDDYINNRINIQRGEIDHSFAGAKYLCELMSDDKNHYHTAHIIARTIASHHGLNDWVDENGKDRLLERISKNESYDEIIHNLGEIADKNEIYSLLDKSAVEYKALRKQIRDISSNSTEMAFYLGLLERLMQSVLIDADRTDTAEFMLCKSQSLNIDTKVLWNSMRDNINEMLVRFAEKTDVISVYRRSISDRCADFAHHKAGVCRLIVPTGGGKTLSSLRYAVEYCKEFGLQRIVYTAPFMSILEQNSDIIRSIAGEDNFTEHHSNVLAEIETQEKLAEYELRTERWDSPVIATTMVQFLNSLFLGKMSAVRRMHRLCKSVIIIDEVQSVPLKCVNMFNLAMNFLSKICGSVIVLCSATQPSGSETQYKLQVDENYSMTGDYRKDFAVFHRADIISAVTPYGFSFDEAVMFCHEKFSESGNLLVVLNTKSSARELYSGLKKECLNKAEVLYLSTDLCPMHRRERIARIKELLNENKPIICVTTQLIEAGVDISFRCVVRSLAGLDNAAQAAGRCNRNGEAGKVCPVYLIKLKEEKLGNLRQIKDSQMISAAMIEGGKYPDLQSPESVMEYFTKLYRTEEKMLSYNANDKNGANTTLLDLLSLNSKRFEISAKTSDKYSSQAFKTAGELFKVIDNNTTDIIVGYNDEARYLINRLDTEKYDADDLRKAQKYSVSLYSDNIRVLEEKNIIRLLSSGAIALESSFYNDEYGLDVTGSIHETLLF